jgi:hypothetical protein
MRHVILTKLELKLQETRPFDRGEVALKYTRTGP